MNVPHTPQHNPWAERAWGELKAESGLDAPVLVASPGVVTSSLTAVLDRLNVRRLRPTLGFRTGRRA